MEHNRHFMDEKDWDSLKRLGFFLEIPDISWELFEKPILRGEEIEQRMGASFSEILFMRDRYGFPLREDYNGYYLVNKEITDWENRKITESIEKKKKRKTQ